MPSYWTGKAKPRSEKPKNAQAMSESAVSRYSYLEAIKFALGYLGSEGRRCCRRKGNDT
jgi:hypothetical protein